MPAILGATFVASLIGFAAAHADGVAFDVLRAGLTLGVAMLALGWAYSAPPIRLASRGIAEFGAAGAWLAVVVGTDAVQRGDMAWTPVAAGLSFALLSANLLFVDRFRTRPEDEAAGRDTLVVRLGADTAKWGYFAVALVAYGWLVLQVGRYNLPQACAAAALTLVLSFHAARQLREHASEPAELVSAIKLTIAAATLHGLVLAATLAFGARP